MNLEKKHIRLAAGIAVAGGAIWFVSDMMDYSSLLGHMAAPYIIALVVALPIMATVAKIVTKRRENVDVPVVDRLEEMRLSAGVFEANNAYESPEWEKHVDPIEPQQQNFGQQTFSPQQAFASNDDASVPSAPLPAPVYITGEQQAIGAAFDEEEPTEPPFPAPSLEEPTENPIASTVLKPEIPVSALDAFETDRTNEIQEIEDIEPLDIEPLEIEDIELSEIEDLSPIEIEDLELDIAELTDAEAFDADVTQDDRKQVNELSEIDVLDLDVNELTDAAAFEADVTQDDGKQVIDLDDLDGTEENPADALSEEMFDAIDSLFD